MSSATESPAPSRSHSARFGCFVLGMFLVFFFLLPAFGPGFGTLLIALLFGWINFLVDVLPKISWNWGSIFTGVLCSALILFLGHWFLDWLSRGIASARGKSFRWPMKWTACGLGVIALCFLIGMAVAGAAHQIGWIAQSEESLYENSFKKVEPYHQMREIGVLIAESLNDSHTVASFRTNISAYIREEHRLSADRFHILMLADSGGGIEGVLVFPRDPQDQKRFGGEFTTTTDSKRIEPRDLESFIDGNANRLLAF